MKPPAKGPRVLWAAPHWTGIGMAAYTRRLCDVDMVKYLRADSLPSAKEARLRNAVVKAAMRCYPNAKDGLLPMVLWNATANLHDFLDRRDNRASKPARRGEKGASRGKR